MRAFLVVAVSIVAVAASRTGTTVAGSLQAQAFVSGLSRPVAFVQDPTQPAVQLVVEQGGRVRVILNGALLSQDFLDLTGQITSSGERGLLGLAFSPDYATTGRVFVDFTDLNGNTVIARFTRSASDPLRADPASRFDFGWAGCNRFIQQPFANHNGGNLEFGDDGYLYVGTGDGGSGGDPLGNAQSRSSLLGKMLRLDVSVPDADPVGYRAPAGNPFLGQETVPAVTCAGGFPLPGVLSYVWDVGLRNPWRYSFDLMAHGGSGALIIGDVGQDLWEEIDYEPYHRGGRNFGWALREGAHDYDPSRTPALLPLTDPIREYPHGTSNSIIGGRVYRGSALGAPYFGRYFLADFVSGMVRSLGLTRDPTTSEATVSDELDHTQELGSPTTFGSISSFGIDSTCELYLVSYSLGTIFRVVSTSPTGLTGCAPPDPYAAVGGGVYLNGQWYPPGYSTSSCATAAPASGWVCVNGGWVPPDHPLAIGFTAPPPVTPVTPTAPPPTPPPPSVCASPQPVSTWVCVNGGWVPPDHPLALGASPAPSTGTSTPPATQGGCTTPDPFISIPGLFGICINGGWVPSNGGS